MTNHTSARHRSADLNSRNRTRLTLKEFGELSFEIVVGKPPSPETVPPSGTGVAAGEQPGASKPPTRVLIADDTPGVRESLAKLLRSEGFEVEVAANGDEAIEKFNAERTDLVLLDLDMPVAHGWDALERILQIKPHQSIILITGLPEPCRWARVTQPGVLIEKPIHVPLLLEAIRHVLTEPERGLEERIATQRMLTRYTRPLSGSPRLHCYPRGGINE